MKKLVSTILLVTLSATLLVGCGSKNNAGQTDDKVLRVGASTTPHAEILKAAEPVLAEMGYTLKITEFSDYVLPNTALDQGDIDANYFQHLPYLEKTNAEKGTKLVSAGSIHFEPLGIYPGKVASLSELKDGDMVAVPNDTTNEARALLLLEAQGLIKLKDGVGIEATANDIVENPKNLKFKELEAAQVARALPDVAIGVINGNYALSAGLSVEDDALVNEDASSVAATTYANIVAVKEGFENSEKTKALVKALQSDTVKKFIEETYKGSVVPTF